MNFRQVHPDFHTSEKTSGIGKDFDREKIDYRVRDGMLNFCVPQISVHAMPAVEWE